MTNDAGGGRWERAEDLPIDGDDGGGRLFKTMPVPMDRLREGFDLEEVMAAIFLEGNMSAR